MAETTFLNHLLCQGPAPDYPGKLPGSEQGVSASLLWSSWWAWVMYNTANLDLGDSAGNLYGPNKDLTAKPNLTLVLQMHCSLKVAN